MSVSVSMPQLGESVTEGTVTRWLKREGDHVDADEPLLEVSTDKVDTEIPSPVSGTMRGITVAEDETVEVGAELAVIDEDGSAPAGQAAPAGAAQPAPEPQGEPYQPANDYGAAPAAGQRPYEEPYATPAYEQAPYQQAPPPQAPPPQVPPPQAPPQPTSYEQPPIEEAAAPPYAGQDQPPGYQPYAGPTAGYQV